MNCIAFWLVEIEEVLNVPLWNYQSVILGHGIEITHDIAEFIF